MTSNVAINLKIRENFIIWKRQILIYVLLTRNSNNKYPTEVLFSEVCLRMVQINAYINPIHLSHTKFLNANINMLTIFNQIYPQD
jgi:hypothetical protein